jgi:hypothetical protein
LSAADDAYGRPRIPLWRWAAWWVLLVLADFTFYVLLTPLWLGGRGLAWVAEWRARRRARL